MILLKEMGLVEKVCAYNKAISDVNRMKMCKILGSHAKNSLKVSDIAGMLGLSQPATTKHLKIMENVGLFDRERIGTSVYYSLNEDAVKEYQSLLDYAFEHVCTPCVNDYECRTCGHKDTCV